MAETITIRIGKDVADRIRKLGPGSYSERIKSLLEKEQELGPDIPAPIHRIRHRSSEYSDASFPDAKPIGTLFNNGTVQVDSEVFFELINKIK